MKRFTGIHLLVAALLAGLFIAATPAPSAPAEDGKTGIQFFEGTWEEALAEIEGTDKLIFVDAYATWCGPCKYMSRAVFTDPDVGAFFNQHFVCVKLDMEEEESVSFRRRHRVRAYPTLFFIDGENNEVHDHVGSLGPDDFIQLGEEVLKLE